jgi:hypothetical protein
MGDEIVGWGRRSLADRGTDGFAEENSGSRLFGQDPVASDRLERLIRPDAPGIASQGGTRPEGSSGRAAPIENVPWLRVVSMRPVPAIFPGRRSPGCRAGPSGNCLGYSGSSVSSRR